MKDAVLIGGLLLAFATLVTVHVAIVFCTCSATSTMARAPSAFFVPPLAPYWALRGGMVLRGALWIGSVILYTTLSGLAAI